MERPMWIVVPPHSILWIYYDGQIGQRKLIQCNSTLEEQYYLPGSRPWLEETDRTKGYFVTHTVLGSFTPLQPRMITRIFEKG